MSRETVKVAGAPATATRRVRPTPTARWCSVTRPGRTDEKAQFVLRIGLDETWYRIPDS